MLHPRCASTTLVLASLALAARAQVEHGGRPPSLHRELRAPAPTESMAPVRADLLLLEDAAATTKGALRFAEVLSVELGPASAGVWEELEGGDRVWRLRIHSSGAKSLALVFGRYQLPEGAELFVLDDAGGTVRGAYTSLENRPDGQFAMRPLRGEALTLEYFEPSSARGQGELVLSSVVHDYRDVFRLMGPADRGGSGGGSGNCEIDVACPLGDAWQPQIDAAVHVTALSAGLLCSGTLLNNTANDGTALVLCAQHCGGLTTAVFTFNYQRPLCRDGDAPTTDTLVGATLLAKDEDLDVQLMRLNVPQGPFPFTAFAAGWDRSDVPPASSVTIHHPAGDVKKISLDDDAPVAFQGFWRIKDWERGVTEGGSSGAPMFDPNGRCVGTIDSGSSTCVVPTDDDFATRLAVAWPLLEPYLDPLGTGQLTMDGLDLTSVVAQPFHVTGVYPAQVEALVPTTARVLRILGSGFRDATTVAINGLALERSYYLRGGFSFLNVDLPPLAIGNHVFNVNENGQTESVPFTVVAASEPKLQVGRGFKGELIFSSLGVDTFHADAPGHVHYCYWSLSNVPSVHPLLTLDLGNAFSDLRGCLVNPIPAQGWLRVHHPIRPGLLPFGTHVFTQAACVSHGLPLPVSNLQETVFQL